ncbi:3'(2'),5'-bisphosphate nucleotidase CysQ [Xanthomarina sp. GH4-25]|uniref:3'(2'),5'-bisphosphate nucleotidase CysQ n=1 Tax=Xanthomarina sp. GH4-25 TaxID=3349335 RepID=UPI00387791B4
MQEDDINQVIAVAKAAGKAILEIYNADDFGVEIKADESPLTLADKAAHKIIVEGLKESDIPLLSEEGKSIDFSERQKWSEFWMVDPVDGTKEFIKRNGEFTVNIALIRDNKPVFGVVYAPVLDKLYYGGKGIGAFMMHKDEITVLEVSKNKSDIVRIVASRSHLNQDTQDFIDQFETTEIVSMGSSLKFMLVAEGKADIYPRFAPTMEWDTAAAHAVLLGLEIDVIEPTTKQSLQYNKADLLNPYFITKA